MDKDAIADLKQFIEATVSQQLTLHTADIKKDIDRLDRKIDKVDQKLSSKIDDLSAAVAEAIDASNEATDKQLQNHEHRITRLEKRTA